MPAVVRRTEKAFLVPFVVVMCGLSRYLCRITARLLCRWNSTNLLIDKRLAYCQIINKPTKLIQIHVDQKIIFGVELSLPGSIFHHMGNTVQARVTKLKAEKMQFWTSSIGRKATEYGFSCFENGLTENWRTQGYWLSMQQATMVIVNRVEEWR